MHNPLEQFVIKKFFDISLLGVDLSFTNASLTMVIVTSLLIIILHFGLKNAAVIPGRLQLIIETSYNFIADIVQDNIGATGKKYIPIIFAFFSFILFSNLWGLLPFGFTITSHLAVTIFMAIMLFIAITFIGIKKYGLKFFSLFFPKGAPVVLAPILIPIEILAYCVRPVTLALRLFLNMTAGHIMLKVFAGFSIMLGTGYAIAPVLLNVVFIGFELFVAGLQAYIFTILVCIYLNDALNLH